MLISTEAKQIYYSSDSGRTFSNPVNLPFKPSKIEYSNSNVSAYVLGYDSDQKSVSVISCSINPPYTVVNIQSITNL